MAFNTGRFPLEQLYSNNKNCNGNHWDDRNHDEQHDNGDEDNDQKGEQQRQTSKWVIADHLYSWMEPFVAAFVFHLPWIHLLASAISRSSQVCPSPGIYLSHCVLLSFVGGGGGGLNSLCGFQKNRILASISIRVYKMQLLLAPYKPWKLCQQFFLLAKRCKDTTYLGSNLIIPLATIDTNTMWHFYMRWMGIMGTFK